LGRILFLIGIEVLIFQLFVLYLQSNSLHYNLLFCYSNFVLFSGHVLVSSDSIYVKFFLSLLIFFCIIYTYIVFGLDRLVFYEYFVFLFLFLLGAFFILVSTDLFFIYISIEMLSVTLYLLVVGNS